MNTAFSSLFKDVSISEGSLVEVYIPSGTVHLKGKSPSVAKFAFYGMWKDRIDLGDSVEYISNLWRNLHG
jgi:hypothetical protein